MSGAGSSATTPGARARLLVESRRSARPLADDAFATPATVAAAYDIQEAAIGLWSEPVAGWKVGAVGEPWRGKLGIERLAGPVFAGLLQRADGAELVARVYPLGFAAVEAEFVFRIRAEVNTEDRQWDAASAADVVESLHGGVEIASSPLASINDKGPGAIIADFGNNAGLLVGPAIPGWRDLALQSLSCSTRVDGVLVGEGSAAVVPGGPLSALAFALNHCARRGRPLRGGQYVCSGATTGIHNVRPGQHAEVRFGEYGAVRCRIEAAGSR